MKFFMLQLPLAIVAVLITKIIQILILLISGLVTLAAVTLAGTSVDDGFISSMLDHSENLTHWGMKVIPILILWVPICLQDCQTDSETIAKKITFVPMLFGSFAIVSSVFKPFHQSIEAFSLSSFASAIYPLLISIGFTVCGRLLNRTLRRIINS